MTARVGSRPWADLLDLAAPLVVGAVVIAAAAGSSIQRDILDAGRPARWVLLCILGAFACWRALVGRQDWRLRREVAALLGAFCALALVSAAWSADPHSTLGRGAGQLVVVGSAAALAGCVPAAPRLGCRLLDGLLGGIAVVAFATLVYWLLEGSRAYQAASTEYPSRFRGIEQNPNTIAMLLAVGLPIAFARALDGSRRPWKRLLHAALLVALIVEIVLSGSRGGLVAGFGSLLVVAALVPRRRMTRGALAVAVLVALVVSAWISTLPQSLPASAAKPAATEPRHLGIDAERVLPLTAEVGSPYWTRRSVSTHRAFFDTSVRWRALRGSVERAMERPLLGWGYGAELEAFVNRYYGFDSQNPENGYVGILLQLGVIGLLLFLWAVGACVLAGIRACLRTPGYVGAAAVGAAAAALLLGLSQSYFHGPGNIAFVAAWTSLLLAGALGLERRA